MTKRTNARMKQADLEPLAAAIKAGDLNRISAEFAQIDGYDGRIDLGKAFCITHLEEMIENRANLSYALLFAAMLRRHRRAGDFNALDYFLTRARETVDSHQSFPQFFQMQLLLAAKRRDKGFFLYDTLSEKTYPHEQANAQVCKERIGSYTPPEDLADRPVRTMVFCASFLPESYNIKHAEMIVDYMVFAASYRRDLRCVLLLTHETVFHNPLFSHFSQDSDNIDAIRAKIEAANLKHGLHLELVVIDPTLPHYARLTESQAIVTGLAPEVMFFAGGYGKCESFYLAHHFRTLPLIFLATSASNTVGSQYTAVFAKDAKAPLAGGEGKIIVVPSTSFESHDVDISANGDRFFEDRPDSRVILSAIGGDRLFNALDKCDETFFQQLDALFDRHPTLVWIMVGAKDPARVAALNPVLEKRVASGHIHITRLVKNFGYYMNGAHMFVSLPNCIGGGFSGTTATSLDTPTVCCLASDLPGAFQIPDLCFDDSDYDGFFAAIERLLTDEDYHAGVCQALRDIKAQFCLENVGRLRFEATQSAVTAFHAQTRNAVEA